MANSIKDKVIYTYDGDLIPIHLIMRVEESFNDTFIIDFANNKYKSTLSIDMLEWELPKTFFVRIHPKHLLNKQYMMQVYSVNMNCVQLVNGERLPISKEFFTDELNLRIPFIHRVFNWFKKQPKHIINL